MKKTLGMLFAICMISLYSIAQENQLKISGYIEAFYAYDFANPSDHIKQFFLYTYNRHNNVHLNLGMLKASYNKGNVRGNLALMAGTYTNDNMSAEPLSLKHIYEANVGIKLSENHNVWIDAGIMPSHIGWESAVGTDCFTLTRSIAAENSPYFETGIKLSYTTADGKWFVSGLILNGWQQIEKQPGNNSLAFGHQLTYHPHDRLAFNSSSFIGNTMPDSLFKMRYFHNFYGQYKLNDKISFLLGFDIGAQQKEKNSNKYDVWYSPVLIVHTQIYNGWAMGLRGEYYCDKNGVIIPYKTKNGFQTYGYSINIDKKISSNCMWRTEMRGFKSKDKIFKSGENVTDSNLFLTSSLAISF